LYLLVSLFCGFLGFLYSLFLRLELSCFGVFVLFGDYQFYNLLLTAHGLVMIFAFIMPLVLGGFTNYWLPIFIGCPDMLFPRMNNLSFWLYFLGVLLCVFSVFVEEGIGLGWTLYPTLLCIDFHSSCAVDFLIFSVHMLGLSSILNSLNVVGTLFACRRRFYFFTFCSLFLIGLLLTSLLLILVLPVLAGAVTLCLLDRNFNTGYFDILGGGDLVLFQHLFWFFGHPEVYVIILPIFGFISTLLEFCTTRLVFGFTAMLYSMSSISLLGFFVWAHHMFTVGLDLDSRVYFGVITLLIGIPTCIKIFNWFYTIWGFDLLFIDVVYFVYTFFVMFLIGGLTGLLLANVGLDILLHDTYFVVAHFHYVLSLGAVVGAFCLWFYFFYFWFLNELSVFYFFVFFCLFSFGANMIFFPLHTVGLCGFPRRISDYSLSYIWLTMFTFFGLLFLIFFCLSVFCMFFFLRSLCLFSFGFSFISFGLFFHFSFMPIFISFFIFCFNCNWLHFLLEAFSHFFNFIVFTFYHIYCFVIFH